MKLFAVFALLAAPLAAVATPIRMDVMRSPHLPGQWRYDFTFQLDNNDSSWVSGQSFGWFVFDDVYMSPIYGQGRFASFTGNAPSLAGSPYSFFTTSAGGHNGPTLGNVLNLWTPTAVGQSFSFWGTSPTFLDPATLEWSHLIGPGTTGGRINPANPVPEPASMAVLGVGLLAWRRRRASGVERPRC